jgi:hypothetical protein
MFWKSKRRREEERRFTLDLMRAAAEGKNRAMINRALGTLGKQLPPEPDNAKFCTLAVCEIVTSVMERVGHRPRTADDDSQFVGGMFAFVASDYVSRIVGTSFETVSSIAVIALFYGAANASEGAALVGEVGRAYNKLAIEDGAVLRMIGEAIAEWINDPTEAGVEKLVGIFNLCRNGVK